MLSLFAALAIATPAHAEVGAILGVRSTSLDGQVQDDGRLNVAGAGIVTFALAAGFEIAAEPGLQLSGSNRYLFVYPTVSALARYAYRFAPTRRVRAVVGIGAGYLYSAYHHEQIEGSGYEWNSIAGIARWNVTLIAGIGVDQRTSAGRTWFGELRLQRGVTTVDDDMSPLFVVNQEVGLWLGFTH